MIVEIFNLKYRNEICPLIRSFYPDAELEVFEDTSPKSMCFVDITLSEEERSRYCVKAGNGINDADYEKTENRSCGISGENTENRGCGISGENTENRGCDVSRENTGDMSYPDMGYYMITMPRFYAFENDHDKKNYVKKRIYLALSMITGRRLPWGTLTGVRPVKMVRGLLDGESDTSKVRHTLKQTYRISDEKTSLAIRVAQNEKKLLENLDYKNGYSLYINIPFCPTRCAYCSFTSYPIQAYHDRVSAYLDELSKELDSVPDKAKDLKLQTIYVGGGTPTTLEAGELDRLISSVEEKLDLSHLVEFTVEAGRPDSISYEKLKVLKEHGIDRISINPQTMNQKTLDIIGRRHTVEDIYTAFDSAHRAGITNINMDIILGLPQETPQDVSNTLNKIKKIRPASLTIHSLAVKRAAMLSTMKESYSDYSYINDSEIMKIATDAAYEMEMEPYYLYRQKNMKGNLENVGFAGKGMECLYNILIMEELQTIIGIGAGATTKLLDNTKGCMTRLHNPKDVGQYIERMNDRSRHF